jgi:hypothetical protein
MIAGVTVVNGRRNPVRFVNAVVNRKTAVEQSSL